MVDVFYKWKFWHLIWQNGYIAPARSESVKSQGALEMPKATILYTIFEKDSFSVRKH